MKVLVIYVVPEVIGLLRVLEPEACHVHILITSIHDNISEFRRTVSPNLCEFSSALNVAVDCDILQSIVSDEFTFDVMEDPSHFTAGEESMSVGKSDICVLVEHEGQVNWVFW